jgi:hypothetical protein
MKKMLEPWQVITGAQSSLDLYRIFDITLALQCFWILEIPKSGLLIVMDINNS